MRIAFDATYSVDEQPSGIAVYSRELMDGLARLHPEHTYIRTYRPKQWLRAGRKGRPLIAIPTFQADIFHALNQRLDRRHGKRAISTFHDLFVMTDEFSSAEFRKRFTEQAKRAAQNSDRIIAVSSFTAFQVETLLGVERERIAVVPHGVHVPIAPPGVREKIVLFVGAIQKRKNVARLVDAFRVLPSEWHLVLAGATTGFGAAEMLRAVDDSPVRDRIRVTGYINGSELLDLYERASIFAFPSLAEGFGIPVLEAMAHGVPVLCSKTTALGEVAGDAALTVDPFDTEQIAESLRRLAGDPELCARFAELGRKRALEFSWERTCRETMGVYTQTFAGGSIS